MSGVRGSVKSFPCRGKCPDSWLRLHVQQHYQEDNGGGIDKKKIIPAGEGQTWGKQTRASLDLGGCSGLRCLQGFGKGI